MKTQELELAFNWENKKVTDPSVDEEGKPLIVPIEQYWSLISEEMEVVYINDIPLLLNGDDFNQFLTLFNQKQ